MVQNIKKEPLPSGAQMVPPKPVQSVKPKVIPNGPKTKPFDTTPYSPTSVTSSRPESFDGYSMNDDDLMFSDNEVNN